MMPDRNAIILEWTTASFPDTTKSGPPTCESCWRTTPGTAKLFLSGLLSLTLLAATAAHSEEWLYTVRPGDNLWTVSTDDLIRTDYWPRLQALNGVADPARLPPGMKLRIPVPWLKRLPAKARVLSAQGQVNAAIAATGQTVPRQCWTVAANRRYAADGS